MSAEAIRILLVDDESGILDSLRILFKGEGYDVHAANSGNPAVSSVCSAAAEIATAARGRRWPAPPAATPTT